MCLRRLVRVSEATSFRRDAVFALGFQMLVLGVLREPGTDDAAAKRGRPDGTIP
jgi:hypothetical protein